MTIGSPLCNRPSGECPNLSSPVTILLLVPGGTSHLKEKKNKRDCSKDSLKSCEQSLKVHKHKSKTGGKESRNKGTRNKVYRDKN